MTFESILVPYITFSAAAVLFGMLDGIHWRFLHVAFPCGCNS
ncbi:MAG: hypothetical protein ACLP5V_02685 [Candidatus Bathyarchaeia archaeon]